MKQEILAQVGSLPPLPNSIIEINRICDDPESSITDLINVVKNDPMATATLLKAANSPLYSSSEVKTIDRAVSMFGKATTKAFVISSIVDNNIKTSLEPYSLTLDGFTNISRRRVTLMIRWYSRVSFTKLTTLATTALLGNIGQLIMSKELIEQKKAKEFKEALKTTPQLELETQYFEMNSVELSSTIFEHWKLNDETVKSIKHAATLRHVALAPQNLKDLALANFIVYNTIADTSPIVLDNLTNITKIVTDNELNINAYKKAIETINFDV